MLLAPQRQRRPARLELLLLRVQVLARLARGGQRAQRTQLALRRARQLLRKAGAVQAVRRSASERACAGRKKGEGTRLSHSAHTRPPSSSSSAASVASARSAWSPSQERKEVVRAPRRSATTVRRASGDRAAPRSSTANADHSCSVLAGTLHVGAAQSLAEEMPRRTHRSSYARLPTLCAAAHAPDTPHAAIWRLSGHQCRNATSAAAGVGPSCAVFLFLLAPHALLITSPDRQHHEDVQVCLHPCRQVRIRLRTPGALCVHWLTSHARRVAQLAGDGGVDAGAGGRPGG